MIRCNMYRQDFSPVDLVDNTIKKKMVEFGGVRQETPQFVSHHRFLRTNLFTDYLNFIRFKFLLFCSPVNQVAFKQCQKNNLMLQGILIHIISYMIITRFLKKSRIRSGEKKMWGQSCLDIDLNIMQFCMFLCVSKDVSADSFFCSTTTLSQESILKLQTLV